jgi:lipid-binding SYLF domain-containing protein
MDLSRRTLVGSLAAAGVGLAAGGLARRSWAQDGSQQKLVDKSRTTFDEMIAHEDMKGLAAYVKEAKGIMIFPELYKAGFIIGAEGGAGVAAVRDMALGWSSPAFYTMASGSIGLQIGLQASSVIFTIMTDDSVNALIDNQFKFGGDVSVAIGPVGKGLSLDSTTALHADVYAFALTKGLFGGLSLEGAGVLKRESWNEAYYGAGATPYAILIERRYANPGADGLVQALNAYHMTT